MDTCHPGEKLSTARSMYLKHISYSEDSIAKSFSIFFEDARATMRKVSIPGVVLIRFLHTDALSGHSLVDYAY